VTARDRALCGSVAPPKYLADAPGSKEALAAVVRHTIDEPLRASGFRKRGRGWYRVVDEMICVLDIQRGKERDGAIRFTFNWGITPERFNADQPPWKAHGVLRGRIGAFLPEPWDAWWSVRGDAISMEPRWPEVVDGAAAEQALIDVIRRGFIALADSVRDENDLREAISALTPAQRAIAGPAPHLDADLQPRTAM
jgi:hypothetical protein